MTNVAGLARNVWDIFSVTSCMTVCAAMGYSVSTVLGTMVNGADMARRLL